MSSDLFLSFLKVAPLLFTAGLRIVKESFYNIWSDVVKDYSSSSTPREDYEQYTVFAFDFFQAKYGIAATFIYTGLLAIYTSQLANTPQGRRDLLFITGIVLIVSALFVFILVNRWFERENYRPEPYCRFFYKDGLEFNDPTGDRIYSSIENNYFSYYLSPSKLALSSEILLILLSLWIIFGFPTI